MRRTALVASAVPLALAASNCPSGAYVIVARASGEPPGYGIIGAVKDQLLSLVPGSSSEAVVYPATFDNYFSSETQGVTAMRNDITSFIDGCPNTPVVLMGYSQGAQVTADALVGQDDQFFEELPPQDQPIAQKYASQVACVILMGDPSFNTSESAFHVGNATSNGFFPRENVPEFSTLGLVGKIQSYCDTNDTYCAGGSSSAVHDGYVPEYGTQAANFCAKKLSALGLGTGSSSNGTSTGSSNSSSTYTASSPSATSSAGSASSTSSSGAAPTPSSSSDASSLGDLRFIGVIVGALVAGFVTLM